MRERLHPEARKRKEDSMSQASKKKPEPPGLTSMVISVVYVATGQLIEYERNPRRNDAVVGRMVESIREFGFVIPILATRDGCVIDGHLILSPSYKKASVMTNSFRLLGQVRCGNSFKPLD